MPFVPNLAMAPSPVAAPSASSPEDVLLSGFAREAAAQSPDRRRGICKSASGFYISGEGVKKPRPPSLPPPQRQVRAYDAQQP